MSAPTVRQGFNEVCKLYKYRGGYDTLLTWVNARKSVRPSEAARTSVEEEISTVPPNAIQEVQALYRRVNRYCDRVLGLLEAHQWLEPGESRLSQRQAEKLLASFPALAKVSSSGLIEMSRLELERDRKSLVLGALYELGEDWRKTMEHENPELVGLFEGVVAVTKSRLQLDKVTALDAMMESVPPHEVMPKSNPTLENLPEK